MTQPLSKRVMTQDMQGVVTRLPRPKYSTVARANAWTVSGSGVTLNAALADPSPIGPTCVSLTSPGTSGVTKLLRNTLAAAIDLTGKYVGFWIKVPDMTHVSSISMYLGDSAGTSYFQFNITVNPAKNIHPGEWTLVTVPWAPSATTGTPSRSAIQLIRFDCKDDGAGTSLEWRFADQWCLINEPAAFPNGVVSLTFDDSYDLSLVQPKLAAAGIPATLFPIGSALDGTGKLASADVRRWVDNLGWEVAGHAALQADHVSIEALSQVDREANFARVRTWASVNGYPTRVYAWPNASSSADACTDVRQFFSVARGGSNDLESLPPGRPDYLRSYFSGPSSTISTQLKQQADRALAAKGWSILTFHSFAASGATGLDTLVSEFNTFIDYLAGLTVEKLTISDVLGRLT